MSGNRVTLESGRFDFALSKVEHALVYRALRQHDGHSLCPDWQLESREALTAALDKLRGHLLTEALPAGDNVLAFPAARRAAGIGG